MVVDEVLRAAMDRIASQAPPLTVEQSALVLRICTAPRRGPPVDQHATTTTNTAPRDAA